MDCDAEWAWKVEAWELVVIAIVLWDTKAWNDRFTQWDNELPVNTSVDTQTLQKLRDMLQPMLVTKPADCTNHNEDKISNGVFYNTTETNDNAYHGTPPLQPVVHFYP